jgi:hypothetical protein
MVISSVGIETKDHCAVETSSNSKPSTMESGQEDISQAEQKQTPKER